VHILDKDRLPVWADVVMAIVNGLLARLVDASQRLSGYPRVRLRLERHRHQPHRHVEVTGQVREGSLCEVRI